jgi:hypothetical protein
MQKWEYCVISGVSTRNEGLHSYYPKVIRLTTEGAEASRLPEEKGAQETDSLAIVIAQMGNEGWELVGCGNTSASYHSLYFKRPKDKGA